MLTAGIVAASLGITSKAAASALVTLADAGILTLGGQLPAAGRGRPAPVWVSEELLALAGASPWRWAVQRRQLAESSGRLVVTGVIEAPLTDEVVQALRDADQR